MLKVNGTKEKEEQIWQMLIDISSWYHKWEEQRNGQTVVCIEYQRIFDPKKDGVTVDGIVN